MHLGLIMITSSAESRGVGGFDRELVVQLAIDDFGALGWLFGLGARCEAVALENGLILFGCS